MKVFRICILLLTSAILLHACSLPVKQDSGLLVQIPDLPKIEDFSGVSYEEFSTMYPPVESAVLRFGGDETPIAADDPRLIRLLNFLLYSESNWLTSTQQSYVPAEDIHALLQNDVPVLDITFVHQYISNHMQISPYLPRMIICGDSYLTFVYDEDNTSAQAERFWPYRTLISDAVRAGQASIDYLTDVAWDSEKWIDLLKYAGF